MSIDLLQKHLPENTLFFLKKWFGEEYIHIKITKERNSKLGDYRKLSPNKHQISINATLPPDLFFFVLTHELAHMIAFVRFGYRIAPHGSEWKQVYREMLQESLQIYREDLRPVILKFSKSPKANFMASPELVRYFHAQRYEEDQLFIENLKSGESFVYKKNPYVLEEKLKKNYLCKNLQTGKKYVFKALVPVHKNE